MVVLKLEIMAKADICPPLYGESFHGLKLLSSSTIANHQCPKINGAATSGQIRSVGFFFQRIFPNIWFSNLGF